MLPRLVWFIGFSSFAGASMPLAVFSDLLSALTMHIYSFYLASARIYHWQLTILQSLFHLFRGKKHNVLRNRIDSCDYDLDQLLVGTIFFTLLSFLLPTVVVFYLNFAVARMIIITIKAGFDTLLSCLNHFPLFALMLRVKDPRRLPGGIRFELRDGPEQKASDSNEPPTSVIYLKSIPLSMGAMFNQYSQMAHRIRKHYLSPAVLFRLLTGQFPAIQHATCEKGDCMGDVAGAQHGAAEIWMPVLEDQIDQLESVSAVAGERQEAIDHVLAGIAQVQNQVSDAADHTPSYDRRQYAEPSQVYFEQTVKSLHDKLNETVTRVTPKSRFQFRRSVDDSVHVDMGAPENDPRLNRGSLSRKSLPKTFETAVDEGEDTVSRLPSSPTGRDYNQELSQPGVSGIRKPSFSTAKNIGISNQVGLHVILPSSAARATASGSLTKLRNCIVDMSVPTVQGKPFPGLSLKSISNSLIVAGRVSGPVHITDVTDSILVMVARQVRIHDCSNVDVYLHCGSHPIIEDCTGMRFAPLPECYATEVESTTENQWDQVDDFKWLKAGHSPNWTTLSAAQALGDEIWTKVVPGMPGASVEETLNKTIVTQALKQSTLLVYTGLEGGNFAALLVNGAMHIWKGAYLGPCVLEFVLEAVGGAGNVLEGELLLLGGGGIDAGGGRGLDAGADFGEHDGELGEGVEIIW
ncbi:hypothetical protein CP533_1426 [Ophiocordyceps camponoti-saundersi (nom. inval.)]|nr:hypothetical protein CP533_1426 [Ophiocordyceps camponoti-saundersi (nom. inval.)]